MSVDAHAQSYERFSCPSGVYLAFEFDSNPSEGKNWVAVFRRPLIKRVFLCALRKTANKFIGGLPKPVINLLAVFQRSIRNLRKFICGLRKGPVKFEGKINTAEARKTFITLRTRTISIDNRTHPRSSKLNIFLLILNSTHLSLVRRSL